MYVGVDMGTSVIKAAAFDDGGRQLAIESSPGRVTSPHDGWFEQDPEEVLAAVAEVVRRVVAVTDAGQPELVGLTGQGDGVWMLDGEGRPTRPAVSWMDARGTAILQRWMDAGLADQAFRRTGSVMFPGCPAPVLAWLDDREPEVLDRSVTAGYCKDAVMQRLTGVRATDASDASLPFLEPVSRTYADDVLALCGLAHRADLLAPVAEPVPAGELTAEGTALLGIPAGTPVTAGPFDLPACALGSGVTEPGEGHLIVGTTLACQVVIDGIDNSGEPAGLTLASGTPRRWLRAMPAMAGTNSLDWVLALIDQPHANLDALLADSPPGARGVRCLPYFSPAGERAPFVEPGARARFDGLTVQTGGSDLARAVCEGIAYAARHCFDAAGLRGDVAVCGGGVRSRGWLQLFADVLDRPVRVASHSEVGAYGAVIAGLGALGRPVDVAAWTASDVEVEPTPGRAEHHAEAYARYRAAVDQARNDWKESTT